MKNISFLVGGLFLFILQPAFGSPNFTVQGRILNPDGSVLTYNATQFQISVYNPAYDVATPASNCLLYRETQTVDLSSSQGNFSLLVGSGTRVAPSVDGGHALDLVFSNSAALGSMPVSTCPAGAYTPVASDSRVLVLSYYNGSVWDNIPVVGLSWVPQALYAEDSGMLGGVPASGYVTNASLPICSAGTALAWSGSSFSCVSAGSGALTSISSITGSSSLAISSGGTNQNITLNPGTSGSVVDSSNLASTSSSTGALTVAGGVGVSGDLFAGASVNAGTSMMAPQIYGSSAASGNIKIDGTSNVSKGNVILASAGGGVGVGTVSPQASMHIVGNGTNNILRLERTGSSAGYGYLYSNANEALGFIDQSGAYQLIVRQTSGNVGLGESNPASKLAVKGSATVGSSYSTTAAPSDGLLVQGNVGIGTTSPGAPLDILGNTSATTGVFRVTNNASASYVPVAILLSPNLTAGQSNYYEIGQAQSNYNAASVNFIYAGNGSTNNRLGFYLYGTSELLSVLGNGNVGIGTTSPNNALSFGAGAISFQSSVHPTWGELVGIDYDSGSDALRFRSNQGSLNLNQTNMTILRASGNVGIGTTSPSHLLDVVYNDNNYASGVSVTNSNSGIGALAGLSVANDVGNSGGFIFPSTNYQNANERNLAEFYSQTSLLFKTDSGTSTGGTSTVKFLTGGYSNNPTMTITGGNPGNVGIGTTNPAAALQVIGAGTNSALVVGAGVAENNHTVDIYPASGAVQNVVSLSRTTNTQNNILQFEPFGSNSPTNVNWLMGVNANSDDFNFGVWNGSGIVNYMTVTDGGNVGIGTTSPLHPLQVGSTNGGMLFGPPPGGDTNNITSNARFSSGTWKYIAATYAQEMEFGNSGEISFYTAGSGTAGAGLTWSPAMKILNNGKVGIGTTSPSYTLHVVGTAGLSSGTSWTNASDLRLKDIQGNYEYGLNEILQLHTVRYNYKKDNPLGLPSDLSKTGFIAQEVEKVIPEAVTTRQDGYLELNVDPIHWAVVNAIKDLYGKIITDHEKQNAEIMSLKEENTQMKNWICSKDPTPSFCK
jgi:hypothetical protein